MTFKMIIAAGLALGVQMASASAPSNCSANANGRTFADDSDATSQRKAKTFTKVADAKPVVPQTTGSTGRK